MSTDQADKPIEPLPLRWYVVGSNGQAMFCPNEDAAIHWVKHCDSIFQQHTPHRAALLGDVAAERARIRALVDAVRDANACAQGDGVVSLLTEVQEAAWLALLAGVEGPNWS